MKKSNLILTILLIAIMSLTGCSNKALEAATAAVDAYNTEAKAYNDKIAPYNEAVQVVADKNKELEDIVNSAQDVINKGETPFDENTLTALKDAMKVALDSKAAVPEPLAAYDEITIDEKAKKAELETLTAQAEADTEAMKAFVAPELPVAPDYSQAIESVNTARLAYEDSIQGLKQITAPTDEFVIERLQKVDTITEIGAVTEDHDPNGMLKKQGGYIGCIYFTDSQVNRDELYIEEGMDNVIDVGCDGGGAVEIFNTTEEAQTRNTYLGSFDGTGMASGSHYVYGTIIVRTSDELNGTQQLELTDKIVNELIYVEH